MIFYSISWFSISSGASMALRISYTVRLAMIASQVIWLSACSNLPYYAQAVDGHFNVLHRSQPISTIIARPDTDPKLKHSLSKIIQLREFASRELKLPDNLSYTSYADLERPYVVWNVFASPELSLRLKEWCFVQVGCVNYRGFFRKQKQNAMRKNSDVKVTMFMSVESALIPL